MGGNSGAVFVFPNQRARHLKAHMGADSYFSRLTESGQEVTSTKQKRIDSSPPHDNEGVVDMPEDMRKANQQGQEEARTVSSAYSAVLAAEIAKVAKATGGGASTPPKKGASGGSSARLRGSPKAKQASSSGIGPGGGPRKSSTSTKKR